MVTALQYGVKQRSQKICSGVLFRRYKSMTIATGFAAVHYCKPRIALLRFPTANLADGTVEEFHDVMKKDFLQPDGRNMNFRWPRASLWAT